MLRVLLLIAAMLGGSRCAVSAENFVTAGGTITEIVFALGAGDRVVATDQSSTYPPKTGTLPSVGYYRDLAAEGVLSIGAERLLAQEGAGREEVLEQLAAAGMQVTLYQKPTDVNGLIDLIYQVAEDIGKTEEAEQLVEQVRSSLPAKQDKITGTGIFLLSIGDRGLVAAGSETVPNLIFEYAGIHNPAQHTGYKAVNFESLAMQQPDFIVVPSHVAYGLGGKAGICASPALALLEAAQSCNVLVIDGLMAMGMTPRLAQAIATVASFSQGKS